MQFVDHLLENVGCSVPELRHHRFVLALGTDSLLEGTLLEQNTRVVVKLEYAISRLYLGESRFLIRSGFRWRRRLKFVAGYHCCCGHFVEF